MNLHEFNILLIIYLTKIIYNREKVSNMQICERSALSIHPIIETQNKTLYDASHIYQPKAFALRTHFR